MTLRDRVRQDPAVRGSTKLPNSIGPGLSGPIMSEEEEEEEEIYCA